MTLATSAWTGNRTHSDISFRVRHRCGDRHFTFADVPDVPVRRAALAFSAITTISRAASGVDIESGFGAGSIVVADTLDVAIEIKFSTDRSGRR